MYQPLLDGRCSLGIAGPLPIVQDSMTVERLIGVAMIMVAARDHPLAAYPGVIPKEELSKHVQLVLTDRSDRTAGREFGVLSPLTWRLSDLFAKHAFLLKGLRWQGLPTRFDRHIILVSTTLCKRVITFGHLAKIETVVLLDGIVRVRNRVTAQLAHTDNPKPLQLELKFLDLLGNQPHIPLGDAGYQGLRLV